MLWDAYRACVDRPSPIARRLGRRTSTTAIRQRWPDPAEPDRKTMAMRPRHRDPAWRRQLIRCGVCYRLSYRNRGVSQNSLRVPMMPRWAVDIIRKRAEHVGVVVAPNEKEALAKAIKQFEIEPARQNRITVTKISDRNDD
jgi:hypothetical protein